MPIEVAALCVLAWVGVHVCVAVYTHNGFPTDSTLQDYHNFDFGQVEVTSLHILTRKAFEQDGGYKVLRQFQLWHL